MLFFRGVGERQRLLVVHLTRSGGMKRDTHLTGTDGWYRSTTGVAHFFERWLGNDTRNCDRGRSGVVRDIHNFGRIGEADDAPAEVKLLRFDYQRCG